MSFTDRINSYITQSFAYTAGIYAANNVGKAAAKPAVLPEQAPKKKPSQGELYEASFLRSVFWLGVRSPDLNNDGKLTAQERDDFFRMRIKDLEAIPDKIQMMSAKLNKRFELARLYIAIGDYEGAINKLDQIINFDYDVQRKRQLLYFDALLLKGTIFRIKGLETKETSYFAEAKKIFTLVQNDQFANLGYKARAHRELGQISSEILHCRLYDPKDLQSIRDDIMINYGVSLSYNMNGVHPSDLEAERNDVSKYILSHKLTAIERFGPDGGNYRKERAELFEVIKSVIAIGDLLSFFSPEEDKGIAKLPDNQKLVRLSKAIEWYQSAINSKVFNAPFDCSCKGLFGHTHEAREFNYFKALAYMGIARAQMRMGGITEDIAYFKEAVSNNKKALELLEEIRSLNNIENRFLMFMWEERNAYFQAKVELAKASLIVYDKEAGNQPMLDQATSLMTSVMAEMDFVPLALTRTEAKIVMGDVLIRTRNSKSIEEALKLYEQANLEIDANPTWDFLKATKLIKQHELSIGYMMAGDYDRSLETLLLIENEKDLIMATEPAFFRKVQISKALIYRLQALDGYYNFMSMNNKLIFDEANSRIKFELAAATLKEILNDPKAPELARTTAARGLAQIYNDMLLAGIYVNGSLADTRKEIEAYLTNVITIADRSASPSPELAMEKALAIVAMGDLYLTFRPTESRAMSSDQKERQIAVAASWYNRIVNSKDYNDKEFIFVKSLALIGLAKTKISIGQIGKDTGKIDLGIMFITSALTGLGTIRDEDPNTFNLFKWEERNAFYTAQVTRADAYLSLFAISKERSKSPDTKLLTNAANMIQPVINDGSLVPMEMTQIEARLVLADSYASGTDIQNIRKALIFYDEAITTILKEAPTSSYTRSKRKAMAHLLHRALKSRANLYGKLERNQTLIQSLADPKLTNAKAYQEAAQADWKMVGAVEKEMNAK